MKWEDTGIILSTRTLGESAVIVSILTEQQGRHAGIVRLSKRLSAGILQAGNFVKASWSARLPEHLGNWTLELLHMPCGRLLSAPLELAALASATTISHQVLAERHPYIEIYEALKILILQLETRHDWLVKYVYYELQLLQQLGYGLDISQCAATGSQEELIYVSPKTGRAVSRQAGLPYNDKLLKLPEFLVNHYAKITQKDIFQALKLTDYFLTKYLVNEHGLPQSRALLMRLLEQQAYSIKD